MPSEPVLMPEFAAFRALWRMDDPQWVAQRKAEWKIIKLNYAQFVYVDSAEKLQQRARFYVTGEDAKSGLVDERERYPTVHSDERVLLTPWTDASQLRALFEKYQFAEDQKEILDGAASTGCRLLEGLPFQRERCQTIMQTLLGSEYRHLEGVGRGRTKPVKEVSPNREFWSEVALAALRRFLLGEYKASYCYVMDCIDYLFSMQRYMEARNEPRLGDWEDVTVAVALAKHNPAELPKLRRVWKKPEPGPYTLSALQVECVESLHAALLSDAAPAYLREQYRKELGGY